MPEKPEDLIPLFAQPAPRVATFPARILLPPRLDADHRQAVRLEWAGDVPHRATAVHVDDPQLRVSLDPASAGRRVLLDVPAGYVSPPRPRQIRIQTDDPAQPYLLVPVMARPSTSKTAVR